MFNPRSLCCACSGMPTSRVVSPTSRSPWSPSSFSTWSNSAVPIPGAGRDPARQHEKPSPEPDPAGSTSADEHIRADCRQSLSIQAGELTLAVLLETCTSSDLAACGDRDGARCYQDQISDAEAV